MTGTNPGTLPFLKSKRRSQPPQAISPQPWLTRFSALGDSGSKRLSQTSLNWTPLLFSSLSIQENLLCEGMFPPSHGVATDYLWLLSTGSKASVTGTHPLARNWKSSSHTRLVAPCWMAPLWRGLSSDTGDIRSRSPWRKTLGLLSQMLKSAASLRFGGSLPPVGGGPRKQNEKVFPEISLEVKAIEGKGLCGLLPAAGTLLR